MNRQKLKIGIQKSGRLHEESLRILRECGIRIDVGNGKLKAEAEGFPLEMYFLRNNDIPEYIRDGIIDIAILGTNMLLEYGEGLTSILPLGFSKCRLSLAVPKESNIHTIEDLEGLKIATSYPNSIAGFLKAEGLTCELHTISGSVEIAPAMGLADAVGDLVSTGSTLMTNGLRELTVIHQSQAALVGSENMPESISSLTERLVFRLKAVLSAKRNKYVLLNAPNNRLEEITAILPGMKSPTVLPLALEGWSSVHSVIEEAQFWENIDALRQAGAEGILIVPIEKMIQ
jgi:ATP phosphoribosyltransferase